MKNVYPKIISYIVLFLVLLLICVCILWESNWVFHNAIPGDDYQFLMTTAIGKPSHAGTWDARFWPLGFGDYSLLLLFPYGTTALGHYIYTCIIMILASLMLFTFLHKITNNYLISLFSLLTLFLASGFMQIHMNCFYSERMLFFMLSAFMLCRHKAQVEQSTACYILAFLSAVYATYLKEPVFGAIAIIAITSLLLDKLSHEEKIFNYALLLNSVIFIAIYIYRLFFKKHEKVYATVVTSILDLPLRQFNSEPLLYLTLLLILIRVCKILIKKDCVTETDSLLFAGEGYAFAYALLNLTSNYYFIPTVVLFVPAFAVFLSNGKRLIRYISIVAVTISVWSSLNYSKNLVLDVWEHRKSDYLFFEYLVKEHKSGKTLFWLGDHRLETSDPWYKFWDEVYCGRYQLFINYYSRFACELKRVLDFDKFNRNSLILCWTRTVQSDQFQMICDKLTKLGFKKVKEFNGSAAGVIVFAH
ncbi:MAG: hypothetical protein LBC04_04855 [Holosporaceae bacterium]|jgi:hypothetical protein|nr:hypothetical protein [Holosporaceae bacterium]